MIYYLSSLADVAELADAHDSGSCEITLIGVQVPSSAFKLVSRKIFMVKEFAAFLFFCFVLNY